MRWNEWQNFCAAGRGYVWFDLLQGFWWESRDDFPWILASSRGTYCGGIHLNFLKDERLLSSRRLRNTKKKISCLYCRPMLWDSNCIGRLNFRRLLSKLMEDFDFWPASQFIELIAFEWWRCILCCSCRDPSLFKKNWNIPTRLPMFYVNLQLSRFVLEVIGALATRF